MSDRTVGRDVMWRDRQLLAISVSVGMAFAGIGMVVPVRVLYAQSQGASLAIIGAMASSFLLSNFLFQYPTGWLADFWGRKPMMVFGLVSQAVLSLVYLVVADPLWFVALRFIEGAVAASVIPSARALIADMVTDESRGEAYGIFGSFMNFGFLLGPALGGLLASFGYTSAFIGSSLFRVAAVLLVVVLVPAAARQHPDARARAQAVPRRALFSLPLVGCYLLVFGDNLWFGFDLTLMPLWMRSHLGASVAFIGLAYAVWAVPNIIGSPIGGRLADRTRRSRLILLFGLLQVPMYAAYGLITTVAGVMIVFLLHGAVYSMLQPAVDSSLAAASPADARARTQSVYSTIGLASAFISANILPYMYGVNYRLPLFAMGAGFALCIIVGGTMIRMTEHRAGEEVLPPMSRAAGA